MGFIILRSIIVICLWKMYQVLQSLQNYQIFKLILYNSYNLFVFVTQNSLQNIYINYLFIKQYIQNHRVIYYYLYLFYLEYIRSKHKKNNLNQKQLSFKYSFPRHHSSNFMGKFLLFSIKLYFFSLYTDNYNALENNIHFSKAARS